jgi:competence protein ComEA
MNPFTESTVATPLTAAPAPSNPAVRSGAWRRSLTQSCLCLALLGPAVGHAAATTVDVNLATTQQLETVRGIGPKMARKIIDERTRGGRFESFEDLSDRVRGIGPAKVSALRAAGLNVTGVAFKAATQGQKTKTAAKR